MKKVIFHLVIGLLILSAYSTIALKNEKIIFDSKIDTVSNIANFGEDFTHTVFLEIGNTQFCGGCDFWNKDVYDLYSKDYYDFEYVNMIVYGPDGWDDILNLDAFDWNNLYNITKYPTSILDGEYRRLNYQPYTLPFSIEECGIREVRDINANISLQWLGNATIKVDILIENNEDIPYNGFIRAAIAEITSRYNTVNNSKFNFGFLDYAFNKEIFIADKGVYIDTITWNGHEHEDNHGNSFGDIIPGNIQVVMGVYNDQTGYVDETVKAYVNIPPNAPDIDGPTIGKEDEIYDFTFVSEDFENNSLYYYITWGDETFDDWFGPFESGELVTISHNWSERGNYLIKAKAKTTNGLIGPWGELEIKIPKNRLPAFNSLFRFFERFPMFEVFLRLIGI
ncbi:MAG: hypothetical protein JSU91_02875 [Thermoplasmatales archaeon]|nr:MAG: hypothetical protein JSU91_02875 [Thermoplasmatales archaeon]